MKKWTLTFDLWWKVGKMTCDKEFELLIQVTELKVNVPWAKTCWKTGNKIKVTLNYGNYMFVWANDSEQLRIQLGLCRKRVTPPFSFSFLLVSSCSEYRPLPAGLFSTNLPSGHVQSQITPALLWGYFACAYLPQQPLRNPGIRLETKGCFAAWKTSNWETEKVTGQEYCA